ncbi:hypothetical protein F4604DRAFT_1920994 [Suillus subluteus]|nr:hypothetical protein F4604DRAFT_1920994 [Suillus subluteus]
MAESSTNSLGLDFNNLSIKETAEHPQTDADESQTLESQPADVESRDVKEKKKPYVNPERVNTGGAQEKRLLNGCSVSRSRTEKIKQRRIDVQADEDAFKKTQETDRVRQAYQRKVQDGVDRTREQNARRKLDKIQNREWDSGKPPGDGKKARNPTPADGSATVPSSSPSVHRGGRGRGSGRGGPSRGRGRGRGGPSVAGFASPANGTQVADTSSSTNEATPVASEEPEAVGIAS